MKYLDEFSLVLEKDDEIIFSSKKRGLRPLMELLRDHKGKIEYATLYDKVIGLAAAKLILYSGMINLVQTLTVSRKAMEYLTKHHIRVELKKLVENIMNQDGTDHCPMEELATVFDDDEQFYKKLKEKIM